MHAFYFNPPIDSNWLGHIFAEIYKDKIFAPFVENKRDLTVLEVGANIGIASYYFAQHAKQVYALEPSMQHFDLLIRMLNFNKIDNVKPIPKALYMENGKFPFGGPANNRTMRSLHMATWEQGKWDEEVEAITPEKLFEEEKIDHIDVMKLDVEGSEIEIVSSSSFKAVAPKIDTIIIEYHAWSGRHPNQLNEALKNAGYAVSTMPSDAQIIVGRRK